MRKRDLIITLFLSLAVLFLCQRGFVSPLFNVRFDFESGVNPCSVALEDVDGDGVLDLAVANYGDLGVSGTVSVLLGNGGGTFQSSVDYDAGNGPQSVTLGNLDGDDHLDLAVANSGSNNVSVLINLLDRVEIVDPKGWSMVSLPVAPTDKSFNKLFPETVVGYGYEQGTGYQLFYKKLMNSHLHCSR